MKDILKYAIWGITAAIVGAIVFVQAGKQGGTSGGKQTAQILKAGGSAFTSGVSAIETGA